MDGNKCLIFNFDIQNTDVKIINVMLYLESVDYILLNSISILYIYMIRLR